MPIYQAGITDRRPTVEEFAHRFETIRDRSTFYDLIDQPFNKLGINCLFFVEARRVTSPLLSNHPGLGDPDLLPLVSSDTKAFLKEVNARLFLRNIKVLYSLIDSAGSEADGQTFGSEPDLDRAPVQHEQEEAQVSLDRLTGSKRRRVVAELNRLLRFMAETGARLHDAYFRQARRTLRLAANNTSLQLDYALLDHRVAIGNALVDEIRRERSAREPLDPVAHSVTLRLPARSTYVVTNVVVHKGRSPGSRV